MTDEQKQFQAEKNEADFKISVSQRFQKFEDAIKRLKNQLDSIHNLHQENQLENTHATHEMHDNCMTSLKDLRLITDDVYKQIKILSDQYNSILNYVSSHYVTKMDHSKDYIDSIDCDVKMKQEMAAHRNEMKALYAKHKNEIETQLASFMQIMNSKPDPIPDVKALFDEKLELVSLNGQNSVLRSTNNEKHIHLIEKKIENIYQLIKQIQLEKQA